MKQGGKSKKPKREKDIIDEIRKVRICLLARPKHIYTSSKGPNYQEIRNRPPPEALQYEASKRIKYLSTPRAEKRTPKYVPPKPAKHSVNVGALFYVPTKRIKELATPPSREPKEPISSIEFEHMKKIRERKAAVFSKFRDSWLELRASPRAPPTPHKHPFEAVVIVRGKKIFVKAEMLHRYMPRSYYTPPPKGARPDPQRMQILAKPTKIVPKYRVIPVVDRYFEKREKDLKTPLSKRMQELYQPRVLPEEALLDLNFQPFTVSKAALKYEATPRMMELSLPMERSDQTDDDVVEDAFTVPRRALKAICSKRTAELAMPVIRE